MNSQPFFFSLCLICEIMGHHKTFIVSISSGEEKANLGLGPEAFDQAFPAIYYSKGSDSANECLKLYIIL